MARDNGSGPSSSLTERVQSRAAVFRSEDADFDFDAEFERLWSRCSTAERREMVRRIAGDEEGGRLVDELERTSARLVYRSEDGEAYESYVVKIAMVNPEISERRLRHMGPNRQIREKRLNECKETLSTHAHVLNGQPCIFGLDGEMLDGQHRHKACVETGISFLTFEVHGVPQERFYTLDSGSKRTYADNEKASGRLNSKAVASVVPLLYADRYHGGIWNYQNVTASRTTLKGFDLQEVSDAQLQRSIMIAGRAYRLFRRKVTPRLAAAMHYILSEVDAYAADEFFNALATGENITREDSVYALRETLANYTKPNQGPKHDKEMAAKFINAWNAMMRGDSRSVPIRGTQSGMVPRIMGRGRLRRR